MVAPPCAPRGLGCRGREAWSAGSGCNLPRRGGWCRALSLDASAAGRASLLLLKRGAFTTRPLHPVSPSTEPEVPGGDTPPGPPSVIISSAPVPSPAVLTSVGGLAPPVPPLAGPAGASLAPERPLPLAGLSVSVSPTMRGPVAVGDGVGSSPSLASGGGLGERLPSAPRCRFGVFLRLTGAGEGAGFSSPSGPGDGAGDASRAVVVTVSSDASKSPDSEARRDTGRASAPASTGDATGAGGSKSAATSALL